MGQQSPNTVCKLLPPSMAKLQSVVVTRLLPLMNGSHIQYRFAKKNKKMFLLRSLYMIQWTQLTLFWNEGFWTANKIVDALLLIAFIQRYSPLLSTPCALVACSSERVTVAFHGTFSNPPEWCTWTAVWLLHGWCHMKLLLSQHTFCIHRTTICTSLVSLHAKPDTKVHV